MSRGHPNNSLRNLPIPAHFIESKVGELWRVAYQQRAGEARLWAEQRQIPSAAADAYKLALVLIDVQNTFCLPDFELFVGGRSGQGAVEDNIRLCRFIYQNLGVITRFVITMDTHHATQIFHPLFLVDAQGNHPDALTLISHQDIELGRWQFNPAIAPRLGITPEQGRQHLLHYTQMLAAKGKYELTIWPYHAMLGGVGHALVPAIEEAIFFHSIARSTAPEFYIKGREELTEFYSAIGPEVQKDAQGQELAKHNSAFLKLVQDYDALIIAGQAKSHCVAWTVSDLLSEIQAVDQTLAGKIYLLEDCTSAVVVPGIVDYTQEADGSFARFEAAGMHRIQTTDINWIG
jgi:nicotinamidase-related amidase